MDAFPTNLPLQLTSFIGREREIAEVKRLLSTTRLLSLIGAGGAGKTRLALQVAADSVEQYANGVWFVDLASLSDPALVPQAIAAVFDLRETADSPLIDLLTHYLHTKHLLVVLDNCEHLIAACAQVADTLLRASPRLIILATSREALGIAGETSFRVPSLSLPDSPSAPIETLAQYEALHLFSERATASSHDFQLTNQNAPAIAQICQRLDGMPLAIELAAARVKALSVDQIAARLDDRLRLLTTGSRTAPTRQQTLRAAIDWSYDLLLERERTLFRRLAVFAGGFTLETAEAICAGEGIEADQVLDLLSILVDKSLVIVSLSGEGTQIRYHLLETIRQYAREKLDGAGEEQAVKARHLDYFVKLAEEAEPKLSSEEQLDWLDRWETEHDNLRVALAWAQEGGPVETGLHMASDLFRFWVYRGYLREGCEFLENLLARAVGTDEKRALAKGFLVEGVLEGFMDEGAPARKHLEESESLWLKLGTEGKWGLARAREFLLLQDLDARSNPELIRRRSEDVLKLHQEVGDQWGIANTFAIIGLAARREGDLMGARRAFEKSLALFRDIGDSFRGSAMIRSLGTIAFREGDYAQASGLIEEALAFSRKVRFKFEMDAALWMLGVIAIREGDYERAKACYSECLAVDQDMGVMQQLPECLIGFAGIAAAEKRFKRAAQLLGAAEARVEARGGTLEEIDVTESKRLANLLREQLDDATFGEAWEEGRAMSPEEATTYAIAEPAAASVTPHDPYGLTPREIEVLRLVAAGLSDAQVAQRLVISPRTVNTHLSSIYGKLGVNSRSAATRYALDRKLV